jgi:hypothetical protein
VDQTVAAQNQVGPGQWIAQHINPLKSATRLCIKRIILRNDRRYNVASDVLRGGQVHVAHPIEIAAGQVQDGLHSKIFYQAGQFGTQELRSRAPGAGPGP